jgi:hypothetical protein
MRAVSMVAAISIATFASFVGQEAGAANSPREDGALDLGNVDTTYGRIDGDVGVALGLGATFAPGAPRGAVDLRLRYVDTVGLFGFFENGFGSTIDPRRLVGGGFEVRPLFLARWLEGNELSLPFVDLLIDSLGFELGAFFEEPEGGAFESRPGFQASLGIEVPLLARANGPWIGVHGGVRFSDAGIEERGPEEAPNRTGFLALTLSYHQIFSAHVVDVNDAAPR